jgi:hypothetical protein
MWFSVAGFVHPRNISRFEFNCIQGRFTIRLQERGFLMGIRAGRGHNESADRIGQSVTVTVNFAESVPTGNAPA